MRVNLTRPELFTCRMLGMMRRTAANGKVIDKQMGKQDPWGIDMDGVIAEFCVAKALNVCPDLTIEVRSGGVDLISHSGLTIDVKSTRDKHGNLLLTLKKINDPCDVYVLAVIDNTGCTIVGWAKQEDIFKEENIKDKGHGKGYFFSRNKLNKNILELNK